MNSAGCYIRANDKINKTFSTTDSNIDFTNTSSNLRYSFIHKNRRFFSKVPGAPRRNRSMKSSSKDYNSKVFNTISEIYNAPPKAVHKIRMRSGKSHIFGSTTIDSSKSFHKRHITNQSLLQSHNTRLLEDNKDYFQKITLVKNHGRAISRQYQFNTTQLIPKVNVINVDLSMNSLQDGKNLMNVKDYENAILHFDEAYKMYPKNVEALLYKGLALVELEKINEAIKVFDTVMGLKLPLNRSCYLLLATSYKKLNKIDAAINILSLALKVDKDFLSAFLYRASLYITSHKWVEAKNDLMTVLKNYPKNIKALLGTAECEENMNNFNNALEAYNKAIEIKTDLPYIVYEKKAKIEIKLKDYNNALKSINIALKIDKNRMSLCLLKGVILEKKMQLGEAALHYEQVAKDSDFQLAGKALFKLAKMKLREKDYYEAHFNIKRAAEKNPTVHKVNAYKTFIDGIVSIMKGKTKVGMKYLSTLENEVEVLKPDIQFNYYLFKAYGDMIKRNFNVIS